MTTYLEQVNEYYNLKKNYEKNIEKEKRNIINNEKLSLKEKRYEYEQIKHKCINCKRPVGSIFSTKYDKDKDSRVLKASCGDRVNPCPFNIVIVLGEFDTHSTYIKEIEDIIKKDKTAIIMEKNKLLFGYISTEDALKSFDKLKSNISEYTGLLSYEITTYMDIIENPDEKMKLNTKIQEAYILMANIKESISNFDHTNDTQFVKDAVDVYVNSLTPKLNDILKLKYNYCKVEYDDEGIFHLIQQKNTIEQLEYALVEPYVINFVTGVSVVKNTKTKKNRGETANKTKRVRKPNVIIQDEEDEEQEQQEQQEEEDEEQQEQEQEDEEQQEQQDEEQQDEEQQDEEQEPKQEPVVTINTSNSPIYNTDGTVTWNNPIYQGIWNSLSPKYRNALLQDHEWLEETIVQYVKDKEQKRSRTFLNPTNLIIPPQILQDGKYDFGNQIYNNIFNNKIQKIQRDILIGMISKMNNSSNTNSGQFMEALGTIVGKELQFTPY